jgi:predicted nucleic acid-binding protein
VIVVSNTSPIANLASIGRADFLAELFDSVTIPKAVAFELEQGAAPDA